MFKLDLSCDDQTLVITPVGEIDHTTFKDFRNQLYEVAEEWSGPIRLDASKINFMYSGGLSCFIGLHKRLRQRGEELHIANPSPLVAEMITVSRLDQVIKIDHNN